MGFPLPEAPRDDKDVATGMVRTIVPVPVVMALRLWIGAGVFPAEVCMDGPTDATLTGRAGDLVPMSCRLKLRPCRRLLADAAPWSALLGWACLQWALLATSLLCKEWKALGAVLLGIMAEGVELREGVSATEFSLGVVSNPESSFTPDPDWPTVTVEDFPATLSGCATRGAPFPVPAASPWETMVTLILARLEDLLQCVGLGV